VPASSAPSKLTVVASGTSIRKAVDPCAPSTWLEPKAVLLGVGLGGYPVCVAAAEILKPELLTLGE